MTTTHTHTHFLYFSISVFCNRSVFNYIAKNLGEWKCQVTSSSYDSDDALSSRPARLVVRIPPEDPQIYYRGRILNDEVSTSLMQV